jgi:hypothetical protein
MATSTNFFLMFSERKIFASLLCGISACCMSYAAPPNNLHDRSSYKREIKVNPPLASEGSKLIVSTRRPIPNQRQNYQNQKQNQNQNRPESTSTTFRKYSRQCKPFEPRSHPFSSRKTSQPSRFSPQRSKSPSLKQLNRPFSRPSQSANQPVPVVSAGRPG